jgi:hypothetical protein
LDNFIEIGLSGIECLQAMHARKPVPRMLVRGEVPVAPNLSKPVDFINSDMEKPEKTPWLKKRGSFLDNLLSRLFTPRHCHFSRSPGGENDGPVS